MSGVGGGGETGMYGEVREGGMGGAYCQAASGEQAILGFISAHRQRVRRAGEPPTGGGTNEVVAQVRVVASSCTVQVKHLSCLRLGAVVLMKSLSRSELSPAAASVRVEHSSRLLQGAVLMKSSSRSQMAPATAFIRVGRKSGIKYSCALSSSRPLLTLRPPSRPDSEFAASFPV
jgi:hypothetical protein